MRLGRWAVGIAGLLMASLLIYLIPWVRLRVDWRVDVAKTYVHSVLNPAGDLPAPQISVAQTEAPTAMPPAPTPTPEASPTPLPASVSLPAPAHEVQGPNNCGPATMAMYLRFYGWEGDQYDISDEVKPVSADRNVNVDELIHYTRTKTGWLNSIFRVGGSVDLIKQFLSAGIPVMIEEGEYLEETYWENDDHWAGHYILITAYDDLSQTFTYQDSFKGANLTASYTDLDSFWKQFNRVFILLYLPGQEETVQQILGADWDEDVNRQNALATAQTESQGEGQDPFAWFNLGMNQVYFEEYGAAAQSFDIARTIGLPQRMLRYQFGPFFAYYNSGRMEDMQELVDYALQRTEASEEALIWKGWVLYRLGDTNGAIEQFRLAQEANPKSVYPEQALTSIGVTP
jgi:hypothetical protein